MKFLKLILILAVSSVGLCEDEFTNTPVVMWHGMGKEKCTRIREKS